MTAEGGYRLLVDLGLDSVRAQEEWAALNARETGFAWNHLGNSTVPLDQVPGTLLTAGVRPPRTGHIGDWRDIWAGRSTVLDYNAVVCRDVDAGYPLLYDLTQTETAALDAGDTLFQPGALFHDGRRETLNLLRWSDGGFVPHDGSTPLFVPFTAVEYGGRRLPLAALHRDRNGTAHGLRYHSDLLLHHRGRYRELLLCLIDAAEDDRRLGAVFNRVASKDGRLERRPVTRNGRGFRAGDQYYPDAEALVDASLIPAEAATRQGGLADLLKCTPQEVPLVSVEVVALCHAFLGAHRSPPGPSETGAAEVHVHWGALAMAGAPPRRRGYFGKQVKAVRWMYDAVVAALPWTSPVYFVLAPVAPYFLWLPETDQSSREALGELVRRTRHAVARWPDRLDLMVPAFDQVLESWILEGHLSPDLSRRFQWADRESPHPADCDPVRLAPVDAAGRLTVQQACLLVGGLTRAAQRQPLPA